MQYPKIAQNHFPQQFNNLTLIYRYNEDLNTKLPLQFSFLKQYFLKLSAGK